MIAENIAHRSYMILALGAKTPEYSIVLIGTFLNMLLPGYIARQAADYMIQFVQAYLLFGFHGSFLLLSR